MIDRYDGIPAPALREIQLLCRMQYPNIVRMVGMAAGDAREKNFVVLEYVEHDLGELISEYPTAFNEAFIKTVTHQILNGLVYMHEQSLLHRDLKPSNVLYSKEGCVKLCDFG